jgi:hypothetical protein
MNDDLERKDLERIQKHHGGPHLDGSKPQRPYWKRMHHSGFFWVAVVFLFLAMGIFVMTDGFLLHPRGHGPAPGVSATSP